MTRALVARLDNDGDVLLAGPAIRAIAAGCDHVTLLCGPRGAQAAGLLPGVDEIVVRRAEWIDPEAPTVDRAEIDTYISLLAERRADVAAILTSFHQSALPLALLLRMAGVPRIAAISEDFPGSLLNHRVPDPGEVPEAKRGLAVAAALGFASPDGDDGRLRVAVEAPPAPLPRRYVVVHPGASVPARAWAPERHAELVERLVADGRDVVVTGAPSERALTAAVAGRDAINLGGATTLAQLAGVLAGADAVVVGNTGPTHLAAAVGTPVVSLFAPTVPAARWRPFGVAHELLHRPVPCAGCRARECPVPGHPCLGDVPVGAVLLALTRLETRSGIRPARAVVA
ncbi:glycosyltransferase family 9 protein [Baekduia sp.]|jgi:ADP-heptose:LPS heptosyltransferase|uniref:glycosyltransferase family 9 protein n=1 Tax=Baekduia sp. TaxID=2600305 RepID=UPI002E076469|nr:glycosyltransferase family 9 protein [Baekduia sp.]